MKNKEYGIAQNWNYIGISTVCLAILTLMVLYIPNIREIDVNILNSIRLALSPYPSYIPSTVCAFGFANLMMWPQIAAVCVLVSHRFYLKAFLLVLFVYGSFYLCELIKNFVCRERPYACSYPGFSFPSCHTSLVTTFCGIIIYLVQRYVKNDAWKTCLTIFFGLWILLVLISRLWLGVHFLSDVLAGAFLGVIAVNLYIIIIRAAGN